MDPTQNLPSSEMPVREPPAGVRSNFVNPQTLAPAINAVSVVMMIWAVSFVIIRLYANTQIPRRLRIEDYFCVIATILAVSVTAIFTSMNRVARHDIDIPANWLNKRFWKLTYAGTMFLGPTLFFAKGAILLLYLRIFTINKRMRHCIYFGLIWDFLLYSSSIPLATYYCAPRIGQSWNAVIVTENCSTLNIFVLVQGVLSVALDLYIFIIPIPMVLQLPIRLQQRLSILSIFGTGILGITAAVVAMIFRIKLYVDSDNALWKTAQLYICFTCENYIAIIVSSMPAVASVLRGKTQLPSWLANLRSRLSNKSTSRFSASDTSVSVSHQSMVGVRPSNQGIVTDHHAGDEDRIYLQVYEGRRGGDYELGLVTTDIQGAANGGGSRASEEGVVHKSVAVHQSTR